MFIRRFTGTLQDKLSAFARQAYRRFQGFIHPTDRAGAQIGQHEPSRAAPIEYVQVDSAGFLGGAAPDQALQGTRISAVDGFTVRVHPLAQLLQALDAWFGYSAFSIGSYIQQIVPAFADDINQIMYQLRGRFPIVVMRLETPGIVDSGGRLPIDFRPQFGRNGIVLRGGVVAQLVTQPTTDQALGL